MLREAEVLVEGWQKKYNRFGPSVAEAYVAGRFTQGLAL
jgi:hypothetical protein